MRGFVGFVLLVAASFWFMLDSAWGTAQLPEIAGTVVFEGYTPYALFAATFGAGLMLKGSMTSAFAIIAIAGASLSLGSFDLIEGFDPEKVKPLAWSLLGIGFGSMIANWASASKEEAVES